MPPQGKVSGFRLPQGTIDLLDELVEKGIIKSRTEGVMKGVARLYFAELYNGPIQELIFKVTKSPELIQDWDTFPDGAEIPFYGIPGVKITITKLGPQHVKIVRDYGKGKIITDEVKEKKDDDTVISIRTA